MGKKAVKHSVFVVMILTAAILFSANDLLAQENTRRSLRGSPLFTPPPAESPETPGSTGASEPLGEDPGRSDSGRPGLFQQGFVVEEVIGGNPEVNVDPFMEEELGGEGEMLGAPLI